MNIQDAGDVAKTVQEPPELAKDAVDKSAGISWNGPFPATGEARLEVHVRPFIDTDVQNTIAAHSFLVFHPGDGSPPVHFSGRYETEPKASIDWSTYEVSVNPLPLVHETGPFAGGSYELSEKNVEAPRYMNEVWTGSVEQGSQLKALLEAEGEAINAEDMTYLLVDQNCHYVTERLLSELNENGFGIDVNNAVPITPLGDEVFTPGFGERDFWGETLDQIDQIRDRMENDDAALGRTSDETRMSSDGLLPQASVLPTADFAMPEIAHGEGDSFGDTGRSSTTQAFEDMLQLEMPTSSLTGGATAGSGEDVSLPEDALDWLLSDALQDYVGDVAERTEPHEDKSISDAQVAYLAYEQWNEDVTIEAQSNSGSGSSAAWYAAPTPQWEAPNSQADLNSDADIGAVDLVGASSVAGLGGGGADPDFGPGGVFHGATVPAPSDTAATDAVGAE